ncbi:GDNF family receptor alpha-like [Hippocampus zosterae]|uniref:GDNF family receptor alpha-like n=1 Tax=Hippocampus zosterae TaxID=109293 RepID=UPI00223D2724|nr:GDNF family receptor alpha-like [Hippocampus zosterae]
MQRKHALLLGFLVPYVCSLASKTSHSDCATCISHLCKKQKALFTRICEGCQIKGTEVCNLTIQTALDRFAGLPGCVCAWEEDRDTQALLAQCESRPAPHKRSTLSDWQSSTLIEFEDAAGSCTQQMRLCVSDGVCNKHLAPVLQTCIESQCDHESCGQETQRFYRSMPHHVAERLVMCECDPLDASCLQMEAALHGSACEGEPWICQEAVRRCLEKRRCRELLTSFQAKCWSSAESYCGDITLQSECLGFMNPALILGGDLECRKAFVALLGTPLHHPCTCEQIHGADLDTCNRIHDVLHNKSHFKTHWMRQHGPSNIPPINESDEAHSRLSGYLLYSCVATLLVGILFGLVALLCKMRVVRRNKRQDKTRFQPLQKSSGIVTIQEFP